jgi:hypothetical protein
MAGRADVSDLSHPEDLHACNIYKDLTFPPEVYEHIAEY